MILNHLKMLSTLIYNLFPILQYYLKKKSLAISNLLLEKHQNLYYHIWL